MKILFISPYFPSEYSGHAGAQTIFRNIKMLAYQHTISVATFINPEEKANIQELEELGVIVIPVLFERNRKGLCGMMKGLIQNFFPLIKSILGIDLLFIAKYNRREMKQAVIIAFENFKPDLVQIEYNVMHHYARFFPNIPKILFQHDISTKVYLRGTVNATYGGGRRKYARLYKIAQKLESGWMKKFDQIITVTEEDKQFCKSNWKDLPAIEVIPPQVHVNDFKVGKDRSKICFIGEREATGFWRGFGIDVFDMDSHSDNSNFTTTIKPGHCCNGEKDADEIEIDCGGADCLSCAEVNQPVITGITPVGGFCENNIDKACLDDNDCEAGEGSCNLDSPNGAVGNLITITGKNFGNFDPVVFFNQLYNVTHI